MDGVRRIMTNALTEEDTRERDTWRNFIFGEGKEQYSVQVFGV
jgi:hypothetical protein